MHIWFRQYAQQMGMQNVRAILPEQIDLLINTSITDIINQVITQNIGVTNDRIISDNSKIGQINALKTLYTILEYDVFGYSYSELTPQILLVKDSSSDLLSALVGGYYIRWEIYDNYYDIEFNVSSSSSTSTYVDGVYTIGISGKTIDNAIKAIDEGVQTLMSNFNGIDFTPSFNIYYKTDTGLLGTTYSLCIKGTSMSEVNVTVTTDGVSTTINVIPKGHRFVLSYDGVHKALLKNTSVNINYLYLVDFSLDYKTSNNGVQVNGDIPEYSTGFTTNYFPVRLIDDAYLADALNDFILSPKLRSPIITVNAHSFDLYFDKFKLVAGGNSRYVLDNNLLPYRLRIAYIAKPNKVEYRIDKGLPNIECNLPEHLHVDILKHAVDLYRSSISGAMFGQQQQDQAQQREIARNQAVPSEGYQNNQ